MEDNTTRKRFRVSATRTEYLIVDLLASDQATAIDIAYQLDDSDFMQSDAEFEIVRTRELDDDEHFEPITEYPPLADGGQVDEC